jgi:hypothetical protein
MPSETEPDSEIPHPPAHQRGADAGDLVLAALDFLRGVQEAGGSPSGPPSLAWQEARLREWADRLGLLLNAEEIIPFLDRGGQDLIPFDVIPCHPAGGFLAFIEETVAAGHTLRAVRTVTSRQS